jgi:hypothetical protein
MQNKPFCRIYAPKIISEVIEGEAVIVNLDTGSYYSIRGSGGQIWELIEAGTGTDEMLVKLAERYASSVDVIRPAVLSFLAELVEEGLIEMASPLNSLFPDHATIPVLPEEQAKPFEKPLLEKYTDMADLLLLDPIHEVDETGWPQPKPDNKT